MRRRRLVQAGALGAAAVAFMLGVGWWQSRDPGAARADRLPVPIQRMSFTLTDQDGATVTAADWLGRPTLVFFGFTWCPDICPSTLGDISVWMEELGPEADRLNAVLISVDPARDTPEVLADYLSYFDGRITGLTGPLPQVEQAAADFRATFRKVGTEGGYTMDHTAGVFLFRADGRFANIIDYHEDPGYAVPKIRRVLDGSPRPRGS